MRRERPQMLGVAERTSGHLSGYSPLMILHSNHRETQYSQLQDIPALITTNLEKVENRPINPKKAEKDLLGGANDCEGISNGGDGHYP